MAENEEYKDIELRLATEIAYADLGDAYSTLVKESGGKKTSFTLSELKETALMIDPDRNLSKLKDLSPEQMNTWSISSVRDTNDETGFYGCVIETGNGNAIVAFRGSEAMGTDPEGLRNIQHDWVEADIGLVNSTVTGQQKEVEYMLRDNAELLQSYQSVDLTGHSLGGNLAVYGTIVADEFGLDKKIKRGVGFDSPGFSSEFLEARKEQIEKYSGKIYHYRWSLVGSMLNELPGEHSFFLEVSKGAVLSPNPFGRHSTSSLVYDEDGNVLVGHQDVYGFVSEKFTALVDTLPEPVGNAFSYLVGESLMFGFQHTGISIPVLVTTVIRHPVIVGVALSMLAAEYVGEFAAWAIDEINAIVCEKVEELKQWADETITAFVSGVHEGVELVKNWAKKTFDKSYREAQKYLGYNSIIKADTGRLRDLAERLRNINRRLEGLDYTLSELYSEVKWTDLWTLQSADMKIGYSNRIGKCADYLQSTAERFEEAERNVIGLFG